ncbi:receptor-like protein kinase FERONIA [Cornus florida]|uniref:receptor-like protein kinase FERONIA n=1 Tax=Cornus florida TaxID=4283 RepID=UPI00289A59DB|nr:receptor-like protein kinase FERONIA [Cornus florida]
MDRRYGGFKIHFSKGSNKLINNCSPITFCRSCSLRDRSDLSCSVHLYISAHTWSKIHSPTLSYPGFERSKAFFTVKAGPYTLLTKFSASLTADILGVRYFAKEFCVIIEKNQVFSITCSPSKSSAIDDVYAFINGIEIVSMPTALYYTPHGDLGANLVGNKFRFYIDNDTALEMVHRLNVGGRSILSVEDLGMFHMWLDDKNYFLQSSLLRVSTRNMITYTNIPTYTAPSRVYQTAWAIGSNQQTNQVFNFTWKLLVDLGFRYLVRLHFCELEFAIGQKQFNLLINNKIIETDADVIKWSSGNGIAVYKDCGNDGRRPITVPT